MIQALLLSACRACASVCSSMPRGSAARRRNEKEKKRKRAQCRQLEALTRPLMQAPVCSSMASGSAARSTLRKPRSPPRPPQLPKGRTPSNAAACWRMAYVRIHKVPPPAPATSPPPTPKGRRPSNAAACWRMACARSHKVQPKTQPAGFESIVQTKTT